MKTLALVAIVTASFASVSTAKDMSYLERQVFVSECKTEATKGGLQNYIATTYCNKAADLFEADPVLSVDMPAHKLTLANPRMQMIVNKATAYTIRQHNL